MRALEETGCSTLAFYYPQGTYIIIGKSCWELWRRLELRILVGHLDHGTFKGST